MVGLCEFPAGHNKYSIITEGDAVIPAHAVYTGMAIGGTLKDGSPNSAGTVGGPVIAKEISGGRWNYNGGRPSRGDLPFKWSDFEWLARNLVSYSANGYIIKVFNKGGSYNMYQARGGGQGGDKGKTLMVFNTSDDIKLDKTRDGRQFGPSVLAPFSTVTLQGSAGYIDGCVVAKKFGPSSTYSSVSNGGQLQMHGNCYKGAFKCNDFVVTSRAGPKASGAAPQKKPILRGLCKPFCAEKARAKSWNTVCKWKGCNGCSLCSTL